MNFLKKLGQILANAAGIAVGVGPIIQPFLGSGKAAQVEGNVVNDLTQVAQIVTMAEAVITTPGSGAQKMAAATPLVLQVLKSSQAFTGKKIKDEALAEKGASEVVQGIVDFMSSIEEGEAKTL